MIQKITDKIKEILGIVLIVVVVFSIVSIAAGVIEIADTGLNCKTDEERFEAIESMNRVQQLQLNDLMYPGVYNGVH